MRGGGEYEYRSFSIDSIQGTTPSRDADTHSHQYTGRISSHGMSLSSRGITVAGVFGWTRSKKHPLPTDKSPHPGFSLNL